MRNHVPLSFPATRKALWSHQPTSGPITLSLPKLSVAISEQTLYIAHGQARTGKEELCYLCGELIASPDCSEITLNLSELVLSRSEVTNNISGSLHIPTKLRKKSRHEPTDLDHEYFTCSHYELDEYAYSNDKIDVSRSFSTTAMCTIFSGSEQIHCDIEFDMMTTSTQFTLTPIDALSIVNTALSKNVLSEQTNISSQFKFGYVTMDQFRKVVLLMDSDPNAITKPIIGIWVSGVDLMTDPFIWSCCMRYTHTSHLTDRVHKPDEPFLLIHKSPISTNIQFYDCLTSSNSLNYQIFSGFNGISMQKEVESRRTGLLRVPLTIQTIETVKGRKLAEYISLSRAEQDKENRKVTTPKQRAKLKSFSTDEQPRESPLAYKPTKESPVPSVPDISMIEECTPSQAPKPVRQGLSDITDQRLNQSPIIDTKQSEYHQSNTIARQINFNSNDNRSKSSEQCQTKHRTPKQSQESFPTSPSLRSPQFFGRKNPPNSKSPSVAKLKPLMKESWSRPALSSMPEYVASKPNTGFPQRDYSQPNSYQHQPMPQQAQPCQCQTTCCQPTKQPLLPGTPRRNITSPLSIITDNVQRLLSPKPAKTVAHIHGPICPTPYNPDPPHNGLLNSVGVSPEVQQILNQQDEQLKALQQQIEKLLNKPERREVKKMCTVETQTSPTKSTANVNTDMSLFEQHQKNCMSETESRSSQHDSSQSHSLIQHDLTNLDLPTQAVARSFASDINVDYESFSDDDSPTNSPRGNGGNISAASWQSPVLGESVSMLMNQPNDAENAKLQLNGIIKNVQDMLKKQIPRLESPQPDQDVATPERAKYDPKAEDVEQATKVQIQKLGIELNNSFNAGAANIRRNGLPKVQYVSMMMSDSLLSDTNRSMEMNALALKYLQDEQLTELQHLTVQKEKGGQATSLLRQILRVSRPEPLNESNHPNMSLATQEYLKRYALTENENQTSISENSAVPDVIQDEFQTPKSILKKNNIPVQSSEGSSDQETTIQVLDIARLRELPKLL